MTPWLVAEFFRQLIFFAAFVFMSWFTSVLIFKTQTDGTTFLLILLTFISRCCSFFAASVLALFCLLMLMFIALTFYFWLAVVSAAQEFREKNQSISPSGEAKDPYAQEPYVVYE